MKFTPRNWIRQTSENDNCRATIANLQFIEYEPEIERYGGPAGILISERQFELSSRCVLRAIRDSEKWNYSRALGTAIQLHIAFAHTMKMDLDEAAAFFAWLSTGLMPFITGFETDLTTSQQKTESTRENFGERFDRNKETLIRFSRTLWDGLQETAEFEEVSLNDWVRDMGLIYGELNDTFEEGRLEIPGSFRITDKYNLQEDKQKLWFIYSSYVHMTNNRLGILNQDEAYAAYLISRCLSAINESVNA